MSQHPFTDEELTIIAECAVQALQDPIVLDTLDLSDTASQKLVRKCRDFLGEGVPKLSCRWCGKDFLYRRGIDSDRCPHCGQTNNDLSKGRE